MTVRDEVDPPWEESIARDTVLESMPEVEQADRRLEPITETKFSDTQSMTCYSVRGYRKLKKLGSFKATFIQVIEKGASLQNR